MRSIRRKTLERRRSRRNPRLPLWGLLVAIAYGIVGMAVLAERTPEQLEEMLWVAMFGPAAAYALWLLLADWPHRFGASVPEPAPQASPRTLELIAEAFDAPSAEIEDLHTTRPHIAREHGADFDGRLKRRDVPVPRELQPAFVRRPTQDPAPGAPADAGPAEASDTA